MFPWVRMNNFDLVIFDCDGILVDSERIANEAFANLLNDEFGFSLSLDDMFEIFVVDDAGRHVHRSYVIFPELVNRG